MDELAMTKIWLPEPRKEETKISLMLSGQRSLLASQDEDGYYGNLIIRRGPLEVHLRLTPIQADVLSKMGVAEYT